MTSFSNQTTNGSASGRAAQATYLFSVAPSYLFRHVIYVTRDDPVRPPDIISLFVCKQGSRYLGVRVFRFLPSPTQQRDHDITGTSRRVPSSVGNLRLTFLCPHIYKTGRRPGCQWRPVPPDPLPFLIALYPISLQSIPCFSLTSNIPCKPRSGLSTNAFC